MPFVIVVIAQTIVLPIACGIAELSIAGTAGGVFLLVAGLLHVAKPGKGAKEVLATWTDLVVGAAVVVLAVGTLVHALARG